MSTLGQAKAMDRARSRRTPAGTSEQATSKVYTAKPANLRLLQFHTLHLSFSRPAAQTFRRSALSVLC